MLTSNINACDGLESIVMAGTGAVRSGLRFEDGPVRRLHSTRDGSIRRVMEDGWMDVAHNVAGRMRLVAAREKLPREAQCVVW